MGQTKTVGAHARALQYKSNHFYEKTTIQINTSKHHHTSTFSHLRENKRQATLLTVQGKKTKKQEFVEVNMFLKANIALKKKAVMDQTIVVVADKTTDICGRCDFAVLFCTFSTNVYVVAQFLSKANRTTCSSNFGYYKTSLTYVVDRRCLRLCTLTWAHAFKL
ncbi:hypothetical protein PR048_004595 [Dryococelus australis]|uniref:Uncharacterized protein n=1 Tax=Dryococelus australis TaxID=614101 RepID=A0ABQ9I6W3_9NEOP|nr:hypothetical protein PR048_004595 [Dryococelus australis]